MRRNNITAMRRHCKPAWTISELGIERQIEEAGEFVRRLVMRWPTCTWAHWSYRDEVTSDRVRRDFKRIGREIATTKKRKVMIVWGMGHQLRDVLHAHAFVPATVEEVREAMKRANLSGPGTKVEPYDPTRNATEYTIEHDSWDIYKAPPLRRRNNRGK